MIFLFELATYLPVWVHEKVIRYQVHSSLVLPWGAESIFPFECVRCGFEIFPIGFEAFPTGFEPSSIIASSTTDDDCIAQIEFFEVFWVLSMWHAHSHTSPCFFQNGKRVEIYSLPYKHYSEHVSTPSSRWSFTWKKHHSTKVHKRTWTHVRTLCEHGSDYQL